MEYIVPWYCNPNLWLGVEKVKMVKNTFFSLHDLFCLHNTQLHIEVIK